MLALAAIAKRAFWKSNKSKNNCRESSKSKISSLLDHPLKQVVGAIISSRRRRIIDLHQRLINKGASTIPTPPILPTAATVVNSVSSVSETEEDHPHED